MWWLLACADPAKDPGRSPADTGSAYDSPAPDDTSTDTPPDTSTDTPPDTSTDTSTGSTDSDTPTFPDPALDDCVTDAAPGHHVFTCSDHTFDVEIPAACLAAPCGLVVDIHGMTMDAAMEDANTRMRALGEAWGYVVVQPTAPGTAPATYWSDADDGEVWDFVERVVAALHLDRDRLHVAGFSQGGAMTWRFLCDHSDVLASVAPGAACDIALQTECAFEDGDRSAEAIPVFYMHGTEDNVVAFDCAPGRIAAVVEAWGLGGETVVSQDDAHLWKRWTGAATVEFVQHDYEAESGILGGHCYPGSDDVDGGLPGQLFGFACVGPTAFDWGTAVMDFFRAHPRGAP